MNKLCTLLLFIALLPACTSDDTLIRNEHLMTDKVGVVLDKQAQAVGGIATKYTLKVKHLYDPHIEVLWNRQSRGLLTCEQLRDSLQSRRNNPDVIKLERTGDFPVTLDVYEKTELGDTYELPVATKMCMSITMPPSPSTY